MIVADDQLPWINESLGLPTPFYLYDVDALSNRVQRFKTLLPNHAKMFFAMKSNHNPAILKLFLSQGMGLDVVSGGEFRHALEQGFTPDKIVFSGVGKTVKELSFAIEKNVAQINVESLGELERISELAQHLNKDVNIAFRMNPDVLVDTHPYIRTGFRENKFGIDFSEVDELLEVIRQNKKLKLRGLALHIGSQIREIDPFQAAIEKTMVLWNRIKSLGYPLEVLDVGGGVGINYQSSTREADEAVFAKYAQMLKSAVGDKVSEIWLEPGRILVASFGYLVTEVQYVKKTPYKKFVIVDTGMHHLLRPALYEAFHRILEQTKSNAGRTICDVVGPICESSDVLGHERLLPNDLKSGDRLTIYDTGAYGYVMSNDYNLHEKPVEYIWSKGKILE